MPADVARTLRAHGHLVSELRDELPADAPDALVWAHVCRQKAILVTCNRADFMELAARTATHPGVILLFRRVTRQAEASRLLALLAATGEQGLTNNINFA